MAGVPSLSKEESERLKARLIEAKKKGITSHAVARSIGGSAGPIKNFIIGYPNQISATRAVAIHKALDELEKAPPPTATGAEFAKQREIAKAATPPAPPAAKRSGRMGRTFDYAPKEEAARILATLRERAKAEQSMNAYLQKATGLSGHQLSSVFAILKGSQRMTAEMATRLRSALDGKGFPMKPRPAAAAPTHNKAAAPAKPSAQLTLAFEPLNQALGGGLSDVFASLIGSDAKVPGSAAELVAMWEAQAIAYVMRRADEERGHS